MTPRSYGVRMHRLFERARTAEDIYASLDGLLASGEMDKAGYDDIKVKIDTAFESDVLREMFFGRAAVYCERNILLPQEVGMGGLSGSNDDKTAAGMGDGGSDGDVEAAAPHLSPVPTVWWLFPTRHICSTTSSVPEGRDTTVRCVVISGCWSGWVILMCADGCGMSYRARWWRRVTT